MSCPAKQLKNASEDLSGNGDWVQEAALALLGSRPPFSTLWPRSGAWAVRCSHTTDTSWFFLQLLTSTLQIPTITAVIAIPFANGPCRGDK